MEFDGEMMDVAETLANDILDSIGFRDNGTLRESDEDDD